MSLNVALHYSDTPHIRSAWMVACLSSAVCKLLNKFVLCYFYGCEPVFFQVIAHCLRFSIFFFPASFPITPLKSNIPSVACVFSWVLPFTLLGACCCSEYPNTCWIHNEILRWCSEFLIYTGCKKSCTFSFILFCESVRDCQQIKIAYTVMTPPVMARYSYPAPSTD